jgi:hypothetical protein
MNYRGELVALITNGTSAADLFNHFRLEWQLSRPAILRLFNDNGVTIPLPPSDDEISDDERRRIQELSLT